MRESEALLKGRRQSESNLEKRIGGDSRSPRPERRRKHPKDGELHMGRLKPDESPVEGRSGSDVQIDRPTCA